MLGAPARTKMGYLKPDPFRPEPVGSDGLSGLVDNPGGLLSADAPNRLSSSLPGGLLSMQNTLISTKV